MFHFFQILQPKAWRQKIQKKRNVATTAGCQRINKNIPSSYMNEVLLIPLRSFFLSL